VPKLAKAHSLAIAEVPAVLESLLHAFTCTSQILVPTTVEPLDCDNHDSDEPLETLDSSLPFSFEMRHLPLFSA
jgi:hypothetical protein